MANKPTNQQQTSTTFPDLPVELIVQIFSNLDIESKRNTRLVSKQWKSITDGNISEVGINFSISLNDSTIETVKRFPPHQKAKCLMAEDFHQKLEGDDCYRKPSKLFKTVDWLVIGSKHFASSIDNLYANIKHRELPLPWWLWTYKKPESLCWEHQFIDSGPQINVPYRFQLQYATISDLGGSVSADNVISLLKLYSEIKRLSIYDGNFLQATKEQLELLKNISFDGIHQLEIATGEPRLNFYFGSFANYPVTQLCKTLLEKTFPQLQSVTLLDNSLNRYMILVMLDFISRHHPTLKNLVLNYNCMAWTGRAVDFGFLSKNYTEDVLQDIRQELCNIQLRNLTYKSFCSDPILSIYPHLPDFLVSTWVYLEKPLLESQRNLKTLNLTIVFSHFQKSNLPDFDKIAQQNAKTLQTLAINIINERGENLEFNCSVLKNCKVLTEFMYTAMHENLYSEQTKSIELKNVQYLPKGLKKLTFDQQDLPNMYLYCERLRELEEAIFITRLRINHRPEIWGRICNQIKHLQQLPKLKTLTFFDYEYTLESFQNINVPGVTFVQHDFQLYPFQPAKLVVKIVNKIIFDAKTLIMALGSLNSEQLAIFVGM